MRASYLAKSMKNSVEEIECMYYAWVVKLLNHGCPINLHTNKLSMLLYTKYTPTLSQILFSFLILEIFLQGLVVKSCRLSFCIVHVLPWQQPWHVIDSHAPFRCIIADIVKVRIFADVRLIRKVEHLNECFSHILTSVINFDRTIAPYCQEAEFIKLGFWCRTSILC